LKKSILKLITLGLLLIAQQPVTAGEFHVYSPRAYRQMEKLQAPISLKAPSNTRTQLLVDYSGSMGKWIRIGIETLEYVLPTLAERNSVGLRIFGGKAPNSTGQNSCQSSNLLANFNKRNGDYIVSQLKASKTSGSTPIEFALRKTVNEDFSPATIFDRDEDAIKNKKIVLVTDGQDTCGGDPCAYIRELLESRHDIMIDVIQLGYDDRLACLAEESGGKYYKVAGDIATFEQAFEESFELPDGMIQISQTVENIIYEEEENMPEEPKKQKTQNSYKKKTPHYNNKKPLANKYKFVSDY